MDPPSIYSRYFRFLMYLAHTVTAAFFLAQSLSSGCGHVISASTYVTYVPYGPNSWPASQLIGACASPRNNMSVFGFPSADWSNEWCQAMAVPATWDVQQDVREFTLGASWNILILITVFEWITASYALMYTEEPVALWALIPTPPGLVVQPFLATVWNLTLLIILWVCRSELRIPDNNLFLYTAILIAVMGKQNYMALTPEVPTTTSSRAIVPDSTTTPLVNLSEWRTDTFIRNRKKHRDGEKEHYLIGAGADVSFHWPQYVRLLDSSGKAVVARLMEYTSTAPILMVGILLNSDSTAPTWLYQMVLLSMVGCNSVSPVIHYALALHKFAEDKQKIRLAGLIAFLATWIMFGSALTVYIYNARAWILASPIDSGIPSWVLALIWVVILGYTSFGVVMTWLYLPFLIYGVTDGLLESSALLVQCFDVLSLIVKLTVAWTVFAKGAVVNCTQATC